MMGFSDIIVIFLLTYYSIHIGKMIISKTNRQGVQETNKRLDVIREKPRKTLEEQKQFLNLKYPKHQKFKWSWKIVPTVLLTIVVYIILFRGYLYLWGVIGITMKFWQAIIFIILFPIVLNYILEKFNIHKGDLRYMLRW